MDLNLNRREALGVLGARRGGRLADSPERRSADLPPALPPDESAGGVRGRMTGAQAAVAALCRECVPCVFGVPGAQNNEFWDAMKSAGMPYLLVTNEASASVMADASAGRRAGSGSSASSPGPG